MEIDAWQLKVIIRETAKEAVEEYIRRSNPTSDEITYSKACCRYGEGWLDHQIAIGAAKWIRKGVYQNSPKIFSIKQLDDLKYGPSSQLRAAMG
jgi:hypothetical protein